MKECVIELLDEVNCKVRGLDTKTNRKCFKELKFILPHARHLPSVKLGRWDGSINFYTVGGNTFINLLDRILPIIQDDGYHIELIDHRQSFDFQIDPIDKNYLENYKWPLDHAKCPNQSIELYDHQVSLINTFLGDPQRIVQSATGSGKCLTYNNFLNIDIKNDVFSTFVANKLNKMQQE